jgi:MFS-type transporter involved in bile tolerance (Atg22 family)
VNRFGIGVRSGMGDFLYENAVASVITLMGIYSRNVMGFKASELTLVLGPAIVVAIVSAFGLFGPLIRAVGPKRVVLMAALAIYVLMGGVLIALVPDVRPSSVNFVQPDRA